MERESAGGGVGGVVGGEVGAGGWSAAGIVAAAGNVWSLARHRQDFGAETAGFWRGSRRILARRRQEIGAEAFDVGWATSCV